ncbi:hypothetical protein HanXRQr2_Chr10g0465931 [Helianthus annuus]|uniref:Uncharacterized protein n=1 Tax=Helianthus annuus TaxID=4232 RepID=A0A251TRG1_HELAN|nr:hypothetical protein HanXRQr2_Chr10g0465931 [Helianthus annuus]KAJ0524227.1 hypothetical protein HanIR_Chr10g0502231 [Helianthus annuus]KAJ0698704.1 hypothetical protein HanLR1_Chr10g0382771 [Helianthus annuus]KAJ0702015.1 hypothetical protein HanOQP8_Chr10g0385591 [Helianthus annuus]
MVLFRTSYVCPTQTTHRRLSLQCVCFREVLSLKKVFKTTSSYRCGPVSSRVFYPLLLYSFKTNLITLAFSRRHIDLHIHPADTSISTSIAVENSSPSISIFISVEALNSIDLHLHLRRSPHLHQSHLHL